MSRQDSTGWHGCEGVTRRLNRISIHPAIHPSCPARTTFTRVFSGKKEDLIVLTFVSFPRQDVTVPGAGAWPPTLWYPRADTWIVHGRWRRASSILTPPPSCVPMPPPPHWVPSGPTDHSAATKASITQVSVSSTFPALLSHTLSSPSPPWPLFPPFNPPSPDLPHYNFPWLTQLISD